VPLSDQVREWVLMTKGEFSVKDAYQNLNLMKRSEKNNCGNPDYS
jgi:hypothetical protein